MFENYNEKNSERILHMSIPKLNFVVKKMYYCGLHVHRDIEVVQNLSREKLLIKTPRESFYLQKGGIAYFNPNQPHSCYSYSSNACVLLVLQFDPAFCLEYFPAIRNLFFETSDLNASVPARITDEIQDYIFQFGYDFLTGDKGGEFRCMGHLNYLMSLFVKYLPYQLIPEEAYLSILNTNTRMERILEYIKEHYTDKLTLQDIADKEGLSASYLSHFFKKNLNQSFQSYVNDLRFEHALYLLKKTNMKIIDICIESGFSDCKYLNKMFTQLYGISPKEFRNKDFVKESDPSPSATINEETFNRQESLTILQKSRN